MPRGWIEGSLALGVNELANVLEGRRPNRTAGDGRRHRAGLARALGETVMLSMVSGGGRLLAQPGGRAHLPVGAVPRLAATILGYTDRGSPRRR